MDEEINAALAGIGSRLRSIRNAQGMTLRELAEAICRVAGLKGALSFDKTKPDGTPRKLMSSARLSALGWRPRISLEAGLREVFEAYSARY